MSIDEFFKYLWTRAFTLEISGTQGSGRRLLVKKIVEKALNEGYRISYVNVSNRNIFPDQRVLTVNFNMAIGINAQKLLELIMNGTYDVMILDNVPRMFFDVELPYRKRWGYVATILSTCLKKTREDKMFITINYRGRQIFGEKMFSNYFTHRVVTERNENRIIVSMIYPLSQKFSIMI
ncbi:MAG: hypothetical protein DRJ35_02210 [Thermoprotei archaeon]|nr:MAG: hypothetical protein DRJ35_02210 [Thermoprotei archaeon]